GRQGGEQGGAVRAEVVKGGAGVGGVARREDAGARPGGFLAEVAAVEDLHADALAGKEVGRGEADDPAAEDEDVAALCPGGVIGRGLGGSRWGGRWANAGRVRPGETAVPGRTFESRGAGPPRGQARLGLLFFDGAEHVLPGCGRLRWGRRLGLLFLDGAEHA